MRIKNLNNTAFTLLEILLASIIFIVSVAGIFATLNAVRGPVINKENQLAAAVFGKQVLETLRSQVNAGAGTNYYACSVGTVPCPDFALSFGAHLVTVLPAGLSWPTAALQASNSTGLSYTVSCGDGSIPSGSPLACTDPNAARKVVLNINWPTVP